MKELLIPGFEGSYSIDSFMRKEWGHMKTSSMSILLWSIVCVFILMVASLRAGWFEGGNPVCTAPNTQDNPAIITDEAGGMVIAWTDWRTGALNIYTQRMSADGDTLWPANGIALCDTADNKNYAEMVPDGTGGAIIIWTDRRDPATEHDIYAQRIEGNGTRMWSGDGVAICDTLDEQRYPSIASDGAGGAIIVWQDQRSGHINIYAQRIDGGGTALWERNGIGIYTADNSSTSPEIISDGSGGAIIAWEGLTGIRAQRVNADGDTLWPANGIDVCTNVPPSVWTPKLVSDGSGGAIIAWRDNRTPGEYYIYAQRVDASGDTLWAADGIPLCKVTNHQGSHSIVSDGSGGAIVAWEEGYTNQDIHAQLVDGNGNLLWTTNGVDVCTAPNRQYYNRMVADGSGGAILIWRDDRGSPTTSYTQRLDADGSPLWTVNGIPIYYNSNLLPNGSGGAYFVWEDYRAGNYDIYVALMDENGQIVPTLLQNYSTYSTDGTIFISWILSTHVSSESFDVYRKNVTNLKPWEMLPVEIEDRGDSYSFRDATCLPGLRYNYRVDIIEEDGRRVLFETGPLSVPEMPLVLYQNYPNPFNPVTRIEFYLPSRERVWLDVYNVEGKIVKRLLAGSERSQGKVIEYWDGTDESGRKAASGIYCCRLRAGKISRTRKMVLLQ